MSIFGNNDRQTCQYCAYLEQRGNTAYRCGNPYNGGRLVQLSGTCSNWEDVNAKFGGR